MLYDYNFIIIIITILYIFYFIYHASLLLLLLLLYIFYFIYHALPYLSISTEIPLPSGKLCTPRNLPKTSFLPSNMEESYCTSGSFFFSFLFCFVCFVFDFDFDFDFDFLFLFCFVLFFFACLSVFFVSANNILLRFDDFFDFFA